MESALKLTVIVVKRKFPEEAMVYIFDIISYSGASYMVFIPL